MKNRDFIASKLKNLFNWGILGIFLLLPLICISSWVAPYLTPKTFFFIGVVDIVAIVWIWLMVFDHRYRFTKKMFWFIVPSLLFLISLTISGAISIDPATSFFSTFESGTGLIVLYHAFLFMLMVASAARVNGISFFKRIAQITLVASVILALCTFFTDRTINIGSFILNHSEGGAMMGNVLFLASYLIFSIFLAGVLFVTESVPKKKFWYGIGGLFIILSPTFFISDKIYEKLIPFHQVFSSPVDIIGAARMATGALVVGGLIGIFTYISLKYRKPLVKGAGMVGLIVTLVGFGFVVSQAFSPTSQIHSFFMQESGNRLSDWREAISGIHEKPVLGWGPENYRLVVQKYLDPHVFDPGQGNEVWAFHPHNSSLEVLVNGGIIGFVFYIIMIVGIFWGIWLLYRRQIISTAVFSILIGLMVAYLLQDQMVFDTVVTYMMLFGIMGCIFGLLDQAPALVGRSKITPDPSTASQVLAVIALFAFITILVIGSILPSVEAGSLYHLSKITSQERATAYGSIFNGPGSVFLKTDVPIYLDSFIASYDNQQNNILNTQQNQVIAKQEIVSLIAATDPIWKKRNFDYHLTLDMAELENLLFVVSGQISRSDLAQVKKYEDQGIVLSPTDPQIYTVTGQTMFFANDTKAAVSLFDKALSINPNYKPAQRMEFLIGNIQKTP